MFLGCQEFRYYGTNIMGAGDPYGCHCASWTVNCPFATCDSRGMAWEAQCLDDAVQNIGFTSLSKMSNYVNPNSVPKALRPYTVHPDYVSTCMYWLPKPSTASIPPVNPPAFAGKLPDFATFYFDGITYLDCVTQISDENKLRMTEGGLLFALGVKGLSVLSITCGSMTALMSGPKDALKQAAAKASNPKFCFMAVTKKVCTVNQNPFGPGGVGGPGSAFAPGAAPFVLGGPFGLPNFGPPTFGPAAAAFKPVFVLPGAPAAAPGGAAAPAPAR